MTDIPTIETERLVLRAQRFGDWPVYADFLASERATYMGGPFSEAAAWGMFCHDVGQWTLMGHGALMLEERRGGRCIGQVGLKTLVSYIHPDNLSSRRLAERLGAVLDAGAARHDPHDLVYRHSRS